MPSCARGSCTPCPCCWPPDIQETPGNINKQQDKVLATPLPAGVVFHSAFIWRTIETTSNQKMPSSLNRSA
eukprot:2731297-Lingulodinium_polyedra.AAC.1